MPCRPRFRHECRAAGPLTTHTQPQQGAEERKLPQRLRQSARSGEYGVQQHARHERPGPAKPVRHVAEDQPANRAAKQGDGTERASLRLGEAELRNDRCEREREQHDVERVERPAERGGDQRTTRRRRCGVPPPEQPGLGVRVRQANRFRERSFAFRDSSALSRGGECVSSDWMSRVAASVMSSTAVLNAASLARDGRAVPLSLRTNWSADARISSPVAGGSKLASVLIFLHMSGFLLIVLPEPERVHHERLGHAIRTRVQAARVRVGLFRAHPRFRAAQRPAVVEHQGEQSLCDASALVGGGNGHLVDEELWRLVRVDVVYRGSHPDNAAVLDRHREVMARIIEELSRAGGVHLMVEYPDRNVVEYRGIVAPEQANLQGHSYVVGGEPPLGRPVS